jgi:hypothetical protein
MKRLSNYTHARYCSDTTDLTAGVDEIKDAINERNKTKKSIPNYYYVRLTKLKNKLNKITNKK